jgi:hypothetical protein
MRQLTGASRPPPPTVQTTPLAKPTEYLNMNSQTSRKIIVASVMAAVVGIGLLTFALRSHPVASVARTADPPTPVTQTPAADLRAAEISAAPAPIDQIPDALAAVPQNALAAVPQIPDTPAAVAYHDSVGTNSTDAATLSVVELKLARKHLAKADTSTGATDSTITRTRPTVDTSEKSAAEPVAPSVDRVKSADELTTTPASTPPTDDQKAGTSTEFAASDSQTPPK